MCDSVRYRECINGRGQYAPLDVSCWSRSHSTPCFALPCALCSLCSVRLRCISLSSHWHKHGAAVYACAGEVVGTLSTRYLLHEDFVQTGTDLTRWLFLFFFEVKMRWKHQHLKWGVSLPLSLLKKWKSERADWRNRSIRLCFLGFLLFYRISYFSVKHYQGFHWCMRCGDCKSPYVLCRCCPCHPVVKAKRGAVARLDKLITRKDSASSMYLIRKYQVGETDKSTRRLAPFTTCHVSFLPLKSNNFAIISVISLRPLTI